MTAMSDCVIEAEDLSKKYLIGHRRERERYTALRDVMAQAAVGSFRLAWKKLRGREDQEVGSEAVEEFWALKDVSFEIQRGEVVGIIGRNGAGKSTLLKILSRITEPSAGRVMLKGRVASLLEVGTGFHPELTGRENIYLNGAILGMTRIEIRRRFDEIVAFADVERFLDTPVKRYSSGMHVRLAFAVAAHLEPEILVVDEVLAVGDAEFQKKCLGKMKDVANHGRTVLLVSHNMAAIASLTERTVVLDKGRTVLFDKTSKAVQAYTALASRATKRGGLGSGRHTAILAGRLLDAGGMPTLHYTPGEALGIEIDVRTDGIREISCELMIVDQAKTKVALASLSRFGGMTLPEQRGTYRVLMTLAPIQLAAGQYTFDVTTSIGNHTCDHYADDVIPFEVIVSNPAGLPWNFRQSFGYGAIALPFLQPTLFQCLDPQVR